MNLVSALRTPVLLSGLALFPLATVHCSADDGKGTTSLMGSAGAGNTPAGVGGTGTEPGASSGGAAAENPRCEVPGEVFCFGECIVANTDESCGSCGHSCYAGSTCQESGGVYTCACPTGTIRCAAACIDPLSHPRYCGASGACSSVAEVGANCGEGGACDDGSCRCADTHTKCDAQCVDTNSDPDYCGNSPDECGSPCKTNGVCNSGTCACPLGTTECNDGCFDTSSAPEACGGCVGSGGTACATDKGQICNSGTCECPAGWTLCGDTCRDLENDPAACGSCSTSCSGGTPACFAGSCVSGACDSAVTPACDGLTLRTASDCQGFDDHFSGGGNQCLGGVPKSTALCYQMEDSSNYEKFRCWHSGRPMNVNGTPMSCPGGGDTYHDLPQLKAGGYCVHIPSSGNDGAQTDGFSIGKF